MVVDSQLGIYAKWTITDTVCPSSYHKMNPFFFFFLFCRSLQVDQQADLPFYMATIARPAWKMLWVHRWKQEHDFLFWQQQSFRSASAGSSSPVLWQLIPDPLKLMENVSLISIQPQSVSDPNTINMGKILQTVERQMYKITRKLRRITSMQRQVTDKILNLSIYLFGKKQQQHLNLGSSMCVQTLQLAELRYSNETLFYHFVFIVWIENTSK